MKIFTITTAAALLSLAVAAQTSAAERVGDVTKGGVTYTNCNERTLIGPYQKSDSKREARRAARNKARVELVRKMAAKGKLFERDRIVVKRGIVQINEKETANGNYRFQAVLNVTLCDEPE